MSMENMPIADNSTSRARLRATVIALADRGPDDVGDNPNVAQTLGEMAFWDRWAEQLLIRWRSGGMPPPAVPDWYDAAINAALAAQWRILPVAAAAALAEDAADAVDREISRVETPVHAALAASGQGHLLSRYVYRHAGLDRIDQALAEVPPAP